MGRFNFIGDVETVAQPQLDFIDKVLEERGFNGPDVTIKQVGEAADNYIANVKRIEITENGKTFKMVAKLAPSHQMMREMGNLEMLFYNEHVVYTEILPKYRELQNSAGVPKEEQFRFAECYGSNRDIPNEVILLEDLKEDNYIMLDRFKPLSNDSVKIVLKNLAIYHSMSYVLKHQEPETFVNFKSKLKDMMTSEMAERDDFKLFFVHMEDNALSIVQDEKYQKFLKGSLSNIVQHAKEALKVDSDSKYSIIQQGDGWTNNILFQMEGETPKSCVLIDYQMARESNPAYDIMYMLFNSTSYEQRKNHYHEFIDYYHNQMDKSLKYYDLEIDSVYPRNQLNADLKRYAKFMLASSIMISSFILRNNEEAAKVKATMENSTLASINEDPEKAFEGMLVTGDNTVPLFKSKLEGIVDSYVEFGLLEE